MKRGGTEGRADEVRGFGASCSVGHLELVGLGAVGRGDVPLDDGALAGRLLGREALLHGVEDLRQHSVDAGGLDELVDLGVGTALEQLAQGLGVVGIADLIAHDREHY